MIRHLRPYALPFLALLGCGSISDPSKNGEHTAIVTGALTGTSVPANARVALVWKTGQQGGLAVGADVPVVNGKFTMDLSEPQDAYFVATDGELQVSRSVDEAPSTSAGTVDNGSTASPPVPNPVPVPSGGRVLHPRDTVNGGIVTGELTAAIAGFIVYEDTNANGQLDIIGPASTTDTVIGGNKELLIVDLRGGGALDYEKLRDKAGVLPAQGLNLMWSQGRWLGLDLVELKISTSSGRLPQAVCIQDGTSAPLGDEPYTTPSTRLPTLKCAPDGRSYTYDYDDTCPPVLTPPPTLCNLGDETLNACAGVTAPNYVLTPGEPVPANWPCTVVDAIDAGPVDASVDATAPDSGP